MLRTAGGGGEGLRGISERSGGGGQGRHSAAVGGRLFPLPYPVTLLIPPFSSVLPLPVRKEGCKCPGWGSQTCCSASSRANEADGFLGH